ncbi:flavin-containing monooxygenase [Agrococcus sp. Ld7]|uniref:flavin-containing monooxygenase n=1 Tax=Agrococcus sp. Ld7 TaxID=649148 RepID=UPI00386F42DE
MDEVLVIGSGPAGLATAAAVIARGTPVTVLEQGSEPAAAWASRYDSLRLNTSRMHSALRGAPFPRAWGQFPTRAQYVGYLRDYADRHGVHVRTGVAVRRIDPADAGWRMTTDDEPMLAHQVVVATGIFNEPQLPAWARSHEFRGTVLHTSEYRNPTPFADARVVIVGPGSTGLELANELARGGAARVSLAVRTPPTILLREHHGVPGDLPVPLFLHLPTPIIDRLIASISRSMVGDLSPYGMPAPTEGAFTALQQRGAGTAVVDAEVIASIRAGAFDIVPEVTALTAKGVVLSDGRQLPADVVLVATGFSTGLEPLVGHLGVLGAHGMPRRRDGGEALPGLRFIGYVYRPGITGYVGRQARRIAPAVAARARAGRRAPAGSRPRASRTPL